MSIGTSLLLLEFWRQSENEEAKQEKIKQEKSELCGRIDGLELALEQQRTEMRELKRLSHSINDKLSKKRSFFTDKDDSTIKDVSNESNILQASLNDLLSEESSVIEQVDFSYPPIRKGAIMDAIDFLIKH